MENVVREYTIVPKQGAKMPRETITTPEAAFEYIRQFYGDDIQVVESVFILLLNTASRTIGWAKISTGGISSAIIDPKVIAKYVVDTLAASVILAHNHPSGNLTPSTDDVRITHKLREVLQVFDCKVADHLILGADDNGEVRFYSMNQGGIFF